MGSVENEAEEKTKGSQGDLRSVTAAGNARRPKGLRDLRA